MQIRSFSMAATFGQIMAADRGVRLLFVVTALLFLPLDFTQLAVAIAGACIYTFLQHASAAEWWPKSKVKTKAVKAPSHKASKASKAWPPALPGHFVFFLFYFFDSFKKIFQCLENPNPNPYMPSKWGIPGQCWEADVQFLLSQITPTAASERAAQDLVETVKTAIQPLFPDADVCGFVSGELEGSRAFRVAVPDIELVISVSPELLRQKLLGKVEKKLDKQLEKAAIRCIAETLVSSCGFKFRRSAFRGEEPKLTLLAPPQSSQGEALPLDVAVNAETPLYAAALLSESAQWDQRAKQLILLVRRWAKDRGICHAAKGYLSPYHWSLLVIYLLQVHPKERVLPPLTSFMAYRQLSQASSASSATDHSSAVANSPGEMTQGKVHTSKLLKDFMHFYCNFDWRNEMINPIFGRRGPSTFQEDGTQRSPLILQDPFRPCNLGRRISSSSFSRTKDEFERASDICSEGSSPGKIFELWVPPAAGSAEEDEGLKRTD